MLGSIYNSNRFIQRFNSISVKKKLLIGFSLVFLFISLSFVFFIWGYTSVIAQKSKLVSSAIIQRGILINISHHIDNVAYGLFQDIDDYHLKNSTHTQKHRKEITNHIKKASSLIDELQQKTNQYVIDNANETYSNNTDASQNYITISLINNQIVKNKLDILKNKYFIDLAKNIKNQKHKDSYTTLKKIREAIFLIMKETSNSIQQHHNEINLYKTNLYAKMIVLVTLAVFVTAFLTWIISENFTVPMKLTMKSLDDLADNNTQIRIYGIQRQDEFGNIARALEKLRLSIIQKNQLEHTHKIALKKQKESEINLLIEKQKLEIEEKEFLKLKTERSDEINHLIKNFENRISEILKNLGYSATHLYDESQNMLNTILDTNKKATDVYRISNNTADEMQKLLDNNNAIIIYTGSVSEEAKSALKVVSKAVFQSKQADIMSEQLNSTTYDIRRVIDIIGTITEKINLLALNAAIEAAQAKEAGLGFSVVAREIKALANQASQATSDISVSIKDIESATVNVTKIIIELKDTIQNVENISNRIQKTTQTQFEMTNNIGTVINEAVSSMHKMNKHINDVQERSVNTTEKAMKTFKEVAELSQQADNVLYEVNVFTKKITM